MNRANATPSPIPILFIVLFRRTPILSPRSACFARPSRLGRPADSTKARTNNQTRLKRPLNTSRGVANAVCIRPRGGFVPEPLDAGMVPECRPGNLLPAERGGEPRPPACQGERPNSSEYKGCYRFCWGGLRVGHRPTRPLYYASVVVLFASWAG